MLAEADVLGGRYRLEQPIATGGMGEVWRATDKTLNRTVAVKVLRTSRMQSEHDFDARFRAEARTLAALNHPHVVNVYDYGRTELPSTGDVTYLVMSYVDGEPLSDRLETAGRLTVRETVPIITQTAQALEATHRLGIVHRDVKPANILVRPDGHIVLVDFGVAFTPMATAVTTGQAIIGTALYMAPEQASGNSVGPPTDIYSLGVVAYHCLAGHPPFAEGTALEVALRHLADEVPPLPDDVPPMMRQVVTQALAKDPDHRFPSASAFAAAARAAQTLPARTSRWQAAETVFHSADARPWQRRRTLITALSGVATVTAFGAVGLAALLGAANPAKSGPAPRQSSSTQAVVSVRTSGPSAPRQTNGAGSVAPTATTARQAGGGPAATTPAAGPTTANGAPTPTTPATTQPTDATPAPTTTTAAADPTTAGANATP